MPQQLPLIERAIGHGDAVAMLSGGGRHTYRDLVTRSGAVACRLLGHRRDLEETRIGVAVPAGSDHVAAVWGIWRAGGLAVPIGPSATAAELAHVLGDSGATVILSTAAASDRLREAATSVGAEIVTLEETPGTDVHDRERLPLVDVGRRALMLYTSGTTSKPKGVVHTHATLQSQIESLTEAWQWRSTDRIPLFLPLHHIHAAVNMQFCGLWSGATIEAFASFDMDTILDRVAADAYTLFMAVPTIYVKLIEAIQALPPERRRAVVGGFSRMRLMVSGSAGLPASVHAQWADLTDQQLLERYGMTEIGMALSNPYAGKRRPGFVGVPLPGFEVRLMGEHGAVVTGEANPGEIQVRGPAVFREYWNAPDVTEQSFADGWFRTGDVAVIEQGSYRILGRSSVDIIKSGGYKLSALEIEAALLDHPDVAECAVVGLPDDTWGEVVAAAVVLRSATTVDQAAIGAWARERMSPYKAPRRWLFVDALPRNTLGKVTKPAVRKLFTGTP